MGDPRALFALRGRVARATGASSGLGERADVARATVGAQLIRLEAVGICGSDMHTYLGHDVGRFLLGSIAARVVRHAN